MSTGDEGARKIATERYLNLLNQLKKAESTLTERSTAAVVDQMTKLVGRIEREAATIQVT